MAKQVVTGAVSICSTGIGTTSLIATPHTVKACGIDALFINDVATGQNIPPFPLCNNIANPAVAAATAAAGGVLTPSTCTPIVSPWSPGAPTVNITGTPALDNISTANCAYGGVLSITSPAQGTVNEP